MPLVFVPTPLGNLGDITLRALEELRACELLVAEDTRVARKLLAALQLPGKELWSYREQNAAAVTSGILERARLGRVAVVCDAGMPGISDPGSALVAAARAAGVALEVLPGPSAALGAAVLSGFDLRRFLFEGFPPRAGSARRAAFARAAESGATSLWYESPQRIRATLADLAAAVPGAAVFLLREYTKRHEEQLLGTPEEIAAALPPVVRGEIVFVVAARLAAPSALPPDEGSLDAAVDRLLAAGGSVAAVAKQLCAQGLGSRHDLYTRALLRKRARGREQDVAGR
ncbi:MAG: 16S rRNA (cytidine(1402)-2'-O)-methyltransferase [Vulcanimicrobiaceae bacterium]